MEEIENKTSNDICCGNCKKAVPKTYSNLIGVVFAGFEIENKESVKTSAEPLREAMKVYLICRKCYEMKIIKNLIIAFLILFSALYIFLLDLPGLTSVTISAFCAIFGLASVYDSIRSKIYILDLMAVNSYKRDHPEIKNKPGFKLFTRYELRRISDELGEISESQVNGFAKEIGL